MFEILILKTKAKGCHSGLEAESRGIGWIPASAGSVFSLATGRGLEARDTRGRDARDTVVFYTGKHILRGNGKVRALTVL
jgi:hypothetical protein